MRRRSRQQPPHTCGHWSLILEQTTLFDPIALGRGVELRNRIVMAPMTTWAAHDDGTVSDEELAYYRLRVKDVGMVITGCTHVQANGIGFTGEFAADEDRFIPSLARLAQAAKSGGAPAILQIFHAGVKAHPDLVQDIVAASAVAGDAGPFVPAVMPRALREDEIVDIVRAFGAATRRAIEAGFDGVELHGAHRFLLQNFVSPHSNRRTDQWGGLLGNRLRFPLAVMDEVRRVITAHAERPFLLGYRISPDEGHADGLRIAETQILIERLIEAGVDYIHASLGNALADRPVDSTDGPTTVEMSRTHIGGRVPLIAAGQFRTPDQAQHAIAAGLPLVAIGQGLVMNPDWVAHARDRKGAEIALDIAAPDASRLGVPPKLWTVIDATPGWFTIRKAA